MLYQGLSNIWRKMYMVRWCFLYQLFVKVNSLPLILDASVFYMNFFTIHWRLMPVSAFNIEYWKSPLQKIASQTYYLSMATNILIGINALYERLFWMVMTAFFFILCKYQPFIYIHFCHIHYYWCLIYWFKLPQSFYMKEF